MDRAYVFAPFFMKLLLVMVNFGVSRFSPYVLLNILRFARVAISLVIDMPLTLKFSTVVSLIMTSLDLLSGSSDSIMIPLMPPLK